MELYSQSGIQDGFPTLVMVYEVLMLVVFTINDLLDKFRKVVQLRKGLHADQLELPLHYQRCFGIQMRSLKQIFGVFYAPSHVTAMITIIFCNYEALMVEGVVAVGLGFIALSWAAILLI